MANAEKTTMDELLANADSSLKQYFVGETITGNILSIKKHEVLIDLGAHGVGTVPRREATFLQNLKVGDEITAVVIDTELDSGMVLISLRKAAREKGWEDIKGKIKSSEVFEVIPFDANRGGLLIEYEGVRGFLPVSQLSTEHYPRVNSSDKDEILQKLNSFVGKPLKVRVLDAIKRDNKLIFSEKEAVKDSLANRFAELELGTVVEGKVTGIVDFGVFVNIDGIEGLIHISEISWERVSNPSDYVKVGEKIKAKIIAIDKERLSLSMKQLTEDPWLSEIDKFKKGDEVEGTVTRITPFGAFVQISPAIEALVHTTEIGNGDVDPEEFFTLNERRKFKIVDIDKDSHKISLITL